jgi:hypothetical protein
MKKSKKIKGPGIYSKESGSKSEGKITRESYCGLTLCENYISKHYKGEFSSEHMGGNTETGAYGRWYYGIKKGHALILHANVKTGKIISAEFIKLI